MYHVFFQPFEANDVLKKGSTKSFAGMLVVASALATFAAWLFLTQMAPAWLIASTNTMMGATPFGQWNALQGFILLFISVFLCNFVRGFLIYFVMHMFTEKGTFVDGFKVSVITCYLMSVYVLLTIIVGAIPGAGPGLVVLVGLLGMLITVSVGIKGIATLFKTDIITVWIGISIIIVSVVASVHVAFLGTKGAMLKTKMMQGKYQQLKDGALNQGYPGMINQYIK